jgi:serine/threonine protein kinase
MTSPSGTEDTVAIGGGAGPDLTPGRSVAPASRLRPGEKVDRYEVVGLLGAGGMAEVFRARDPRLGREVALKLVRPLAAEGAACGSLCSLLAQEARTMARLSHPSLMSVYDVGEHHGCVYLAMELVDGTTLREWATDAVDRRARLRALIDAGRGLVAAHGAKVVHRDVKPDNILVDRSGRVIVADFGLARNLADFDDADPGRHLGAAARATGRRAAGSLRRPGARSPRDTACPLPEPRRLARPALGLNPVTHSGLLRDALHAAARQLATRRAGPGGAVALAA